MKIWPRRRPATLRCKRRWPACTRIRGDLTKAREYYQKLLTANPKDVTATIELGRVAIKSGDPQGSLDPLNRAYSLAVQMDNQEQKAASLHCHGCGLRDVEQARREPAQRRAGPYHLAADRSEARPCPQPERDGLGSSCRLAKPKRRWPTIQEALRCGVRSATGAAWATR